MIAPAMLHNHCASARFCDATGDVLVAPSSESVLPSLQPRLGDSTIIFSPLQDSAKARPRRRHGQLHRSQVNQPDEDNFIGRSNALDDFDRSAEIATDFDVVEFNAVIGFHDSDL